MQQRSRSDSIFLSLNDGEEHKNLTEMEKRIITGEILGDGSLQVGKGITPRYAHSCKYYEYLLWLQSLLPNVYWLEPDITAYADPKTDITYYGIRSKIHPEFTEIFDQFYEIKKDNRKRKKIPENLVIDGIVLLHWFLGDGTSNYYVDKKGKVCWDVSIAAQGFKEDDLNRIVIPQLNKMGITCCVKKGKSGCTIRFYAEAYRRLYEVIGWAVKSPTSEEACDLFELLS